jgi:hypothetical protein
MSALLLWMLLQAPSPPVGVDRFGPDAVLMGADGSATRGGKTLVCGWALVNPSFAGMTVAAPVVAWYSFATGTWTDWETASYGLPRPEVAAIYGRDSQVGWCHEKTLPAGVYQVAVQASGSMSAIGSVQTRSFTVSVGGTLWHEVASPWSGMVLPTGFEVSGSAHVNPVFSVPSFEVANYPPDGIIAVRVVAVDASRPHAGAVAVFAATVTPNGAGNPVASYRATVTLPAGFYDLTVAAFSSDGQVERRVMRVRVQ